MKTPVCPTPSLDCRIADARNRLYRVALAWCGDAMLADDLVQETLSAGIAKKSQLRDEKKLYAWLYSILHNQWNSYLRSKKPHDILDDQLASEESGPIEDSEQAEIIQRVRQAIATLPMTERQVIALVDLDELSYCDVAEVLEIPIGTVMSRLHRARKRLLDKMEHAEPGRKANRKTIRLVE